MNDSASTGTGPGRSRNGRIGLALFWIYVLLYAGFMAVVLFRPDLLSNRPFGGINLAIAYGMGLIAGAFVLALVYMAACRPTDESAQRR
jgi:uncharacterized membrane protein (DUF485 family)